MDICICGSFKCGQFSVFQLAHLVKVSISVNASLGMVEPPEEVRGLIDSAMIGVDDQDGIVWEGMRRGNGGCWCFDSEYAITNGDICNRSQIVFACGYIRCSHGF